jgi:curved DNA-binding protein CbpA
VALSTNRPQPSASGKLEKTPLLHLVVYALEKRLSGSLELSNAASGESAAVVFVDGMPAKIRTSDGIFFLGRVLLELGHLTEEALDRTLAERAAGETRLHGQILLEAGLITPDMLAAGLREQLARKLSHALTLPEDTAYAYYDGFDALNGYGGPELLPLDPLPLVWSAIREQPPWAHVHTALTKLGLSPIRLSARADVSRFGFEGKELKAIDLLRQRPVKVTELTGAELLSPRVAQLLVYCLLITKQVGIGKPAVAPAATAFAPSEPSTGHSGVSHVSGISGISVTPSGLKTAALAGQLKPNMPSPLGSGAMPPVRPPAPTTKPQVPVRASQAPKPQKLPDPPPSLSDALKERWREITERATFIDREDYFTMLEVGKDVTSEAIQKAFFELAKRWHPDRLPPELAPVREACQRVFARLNEAQSTLSNPEQRKRYAEIAKDGGGTPEAQEKVASVLEAATAFQKADFFFKRGDYAQAEALCKAAIALDETQADYVALAAWLEALKPENQGEAATVKAIGKLGEAIKLNSKCERAFFFRGNLHKRSNNELAAIRDFRRAAELNPHNIDAAREVRLYEMRVTGKGKPAGAGGAGKNSEPPKGGVFGKLFKK